MGDEVTGGAVVEADAAARSLAAPNRVLTPLIGVHPVVAGLRDMAGNAGAGGRTQERHLFRPLRDRKEIGGGQQVIQEYLQPAVEQRRTGDVALLGACRPQPLIHLDIKQIGLGQVVHQDAPDRPEIRAVLECLAQDRLQALVEILVVSENGRLEAIGIYVCQSGRHAERRIAAQHAHLPAAVDLAPGVDLVGTRGDRERELLRIRRDRLHDRLQPHRRFGNRTRLKKFERLEVDRNPA